jgi:hypothetical protein
VRKKVKIFDFPLARFHSRAYSLRMSNNATAMKIEIGTTVKRIANDYTGGRIGQVIEINDEDRRARVAWNGCPRTWVKFAALEIMQPAGKQIGPWQETPNMKSHKAARTITLADGTVYREYRK